MLKDSLVLTLLSLHTAESNFKPNGYYCAKVIPRVIRSLCDGTCCVGFQTQNYTYNTHTKWLFCLPLWMFGDAWSATTAEFYSKVPNSRADISVLLPGIGWQSNLLKFCRLRHRRKRNKKIPVTENIWIINRPMQGEQITDIPVPLQLIILVILLILLLLLRLVILLMLLILLLLRPLLLIPPATYRGSFAQGT